MEKNEKWALSIIFLVSLIIVITFLFINRNTENPTLIDNVLNGQIISKTEYKKLNKAINDYHIKNLIVCVFNENGGEYLERIGESDLLINLDKNFTEINQLIYPKSISYEGNNIVAEDVITGIPYKVSKKSCFVYDIKKQTISFKIT